MSLETWKAEFYPIPAEEVSTDDALRHNLALWVGIRQENLDKHDVIYHSHAVYDGAHTNNPFPMDSNTCALCKQHADTCATCPIYDVKFKASVYKQLAGCHDAYRIFLKEDTPEPMINLLQTAIDMQQAPQTVL